MKQKFTGVNNYTFLYAFIRRRKVANWYLYRRNFRGILIGVRNISDSLQNNGMKFLLGRANGVFLAS